MKDNNIYRNIATRTGGDIYIGVVGPVRTGKSTFIKSFMENLVIPNIDESFKRKRAIDELPQSASGKTIMTTEPKFIPNESVEVNLDKGITFKTRMVDCVGYLVDGALGDIEEDKPRMVDTPWSEERIPFKEAAEIGTKKVIEDHSTIGVLVTTDGSFSELSRDAYVEAERKVVNELKAINKPFVIVLNSNIPEATSTKMLARNLEKSYDVPVVETDVSKLDENGIQRIFNKVLDEFPISELSFNLPSWIDFLNIDNVVKKDIIGIIKNNFLSVSNIREINNLIDKLKDETEIIDNISIETANMENGNITLNIKIKSELFYKTISDMSSIDIKNDGDIFMHINEYANIKNKYNRIQGALEEVRIKGYGIVTPELEELSLEEPEIFKNGNKFGVKLKASAPSIHLIRADIETEVSPIVGSEKQSEDLVKYLLSEFESDPKKIWQSNIFGKSLHELVNEGLHNKLYKMPDEAQMKLQETLTKIINEGSGGLICIIL